MDCINYSSSEYKSLLRDSGLSRLELDAAILVHQDNTKTDSFPSLDSVKVSIPEQTSVRKYIDTVKSLKNENLIYSGSDISNNYYVNDLDGLTDSKISRIKELSQDYNVSFIKDNIGTLISFNEKTDKINRDQRAISGIMFQNIINKMSEIVPGLKVQGMSNEDFIDFSEKIGVNKEYNSPTFIVGDTIFYNHEATFLTKDMAIEESLHPIVNGIKNNDTELFRDLFNEAKQNYPKLWNDIKESYKTNHSEELITQALSREFSNIENIKMSKNIILRALEAIKTFFNKIFNYDSKSVSDSPKMALSAIVEDLNTKSGNLTPNYDFDSTYFHTLTPRRSNKAYPDSVSNKTFQDFVNKKANDIKMALEIRHKNINKGIKSNANVVRNINKIIRATSDENLDAELKRNRVNMDIMSQEQLDLLKGEMIIAKFLDRMYEDMNDMSKSLSHVLNNLNDNIPTSITLERLDDLKITYIDWYDQTQENLTDAFESASDFFKSYTNYVNNKTKIDPNEKIKDKDYYKNTFNELNNMFQTVLSKYNSIRVILLKNEIRKELVDADTPQSIINGIIDEVSNTANDVGAFYRIFGSINYAKDSLLRLMGYYVTEAKEKVEHKVNKDLLELEKALNKLRKRRGSGRLIYNIDELFSEYIVDDAKSHFKDPKKRLSKSGNWISDLNRGQAWLNYKKDIQKLLSEYDLNERDEIDTLSREDRVNYLKDENKIKDKHYERRFITEYYDALSEIIPEAIDAKADIDDLITGMIESVTDKDGVVHTEWFQKSQAQAYESLKKQKRNLANIYDEDGNEKFGVEREIAESLTKFNEKVQELSSKQKSKFVPEWEAKWNELKNNYAKKLPGSDIALRNWEMTNVRTVYKQSFWDRLNKVAKKDFGEEYADLQSKRSDLLRLYRNTYDLEVAVGNSSRNSNKSSVTGLTNKEAMSEELKDKIKFIDKRLAEIRSDAEAKKVPGLSFKSVAKIVPSSEYNAIVSSFDKTSQEYLDWYNSNHYEIQTGSGKSMMLPYSYWTVLQPVDTSLIVSEPSSLWNDATPDFALSNPNYQSDLSEEGMIPKRSLYDNSAQFNKIKNDPELFELYNLLRDMMKNSQDLLGDINYGSSLHLPQTTGKFVKKFKSEYSKGRNLKAALKGLRFILRDSLTLDSDDPEYNRQDRENLSRFENVRSNRFIPTYYNRRLDNPDALDKNLIGNVIEYVRMANNYKEMKAILPKLNLINEQIAKRQVSKKGKLDSGAKSNLALKAEEFLNVNVYNRKHSLSVPAPKIIQRILGSPQNNNKVEISFAKPLASLRSWIVMVNLAWKPVPIIADYITAQFDIEIEGLVGRYFTSKDLQRGKIELLKSVIPWLLNSGSNTKTKNIFGKSPNKLVNLMMFNEMAFSSQSRTQNIHLTGNGLNSFYRAIKQNAAFWGWNTSDYLVKSQVTAAVYMNHKLVDGKIIDRHTFLRKYYPNNKKEGNTAWELQGKSLYDAISVNKSTGEFEFSDDSFKKAYNSNIELRIKGLLHKTMSEIDGQLRETDKTALQANVITSYLTMHRGFLFSNIFKQYRPATYDFYTKRMEIGNYRGTANWIKNYFSGNPIEDIDLESLHLKKSVLDSVRFTSYVVSSVIMAMILTHFFMNAADDDKDDINAQYMALQMSRIQFEMMSKINPGEWTQIVENPTAAMGFFNTLRGLDDWLKPGEVKSGVYKGMPYMKKQLIKLTPYKNIYETMNADPALYRKRNQLLYKDISPYNIYKQWDEYRKTHRENSQNEEPQGIQYE